MADDAILLDDDLSEERILVILHNRRFLFDASLGAVGWVRRYNRWAASESDRLNAGKTAEERRLAEDENLDQLVGLAEEVLSPCNPEWDRAGLETLRAGDLVEVLRFFKTASYGGSAALKRIANQNAQAQALPTAPSGIRATSGIAQKSRPNRAARRSA